MAVGPADRPVLCACAGPVVGDGEKRERNGRHGCAKVKRKENGRRRRGGTGRVRKFHVGVRAPHVIRRTEPRRHVAI